MIDEASYILNQNQLSLYERTSSDRMSPCIWNGRKVEQVEMHSVVNKPNSIPYPQETIDNKRKEAQQLEQAADRHMKKSWEALGNYQPGTVVKESFESLKSRAASDRLKNEVVQMENENIDHRNQGK